MCEGVVQGREQGVVNTKVAEVVETGHVVQDVAEAVAPSVVFEAGGPDLAGGGCLSTIRELGTAIVGLKSDEAIEKSKQRDHVQARSGAYKGRRD